MTSRVPSALLETMIGHIVVVDLKSTYVCLGTLVACDEHYMEIGMPISTISGTVRRRERSTPTTRFDSGIRRNRLRVLIRLDDVVAISRFDEIAET